MNVNYRMEIYAIATENGKEYVAHFPALKGLSGGGITQQEAISSLLEDFEYYVQVVKEEGLSLPKEDIYEEPEKYRSYKGNFTVRTTPEIHQYLTEESTRHNLSLNAYVNNLFSQDMGGRLLFEKAYELACAMSKLNF